MWNLSLSLPSSLVFNQEAISLLFLVEFGNVWTYFGGQSWEVLPASSNRRPRFLFNILQWSNPYNKEFSSKMPTATRLRNPLNFYSRSDVWSTSHNSGAAVHSGVSR